MTHTDVRPAGALVRRFVGFLAVVSTLTAPLPSLGGSLRATEERPAKVLFVGTFHFDDPGLDVAQFEALDITSEAKQAEVLEVVKRLARFRPTKVALEATPDRTEEFEKLYRAYRTGGHELTVNERQQLGFRVAAGQGLPRVRLIDHLGSFPVGPVMQYAQEHDPQFVQRFQAAIKFFEDEMNRFQRELTIREVLLKLSLLDNVELGQSIYVDAAQVGGGDTFVGADLMTAWFDRNVRIFANLTAIAEPGDRILVLFDAGHSYMLRDLIRTAPNLELVDSAEYLGP